jgi:hypothetical protein
VTILSSSLEGDLERRQVPTIECMAREAERKWLHGETVSIRVEADPDQP